MQESGFHFSTQDDRWVCATGEERGQLLSPVIKDQPGEQIEISFK